MEGGEQPKQAQTIEADDTARRSTMPTCPGCQSQCKGKQCRACYEKKNTKGDDTFNLQEIISSQNVDLNQSSLSSNDDGRLFSNPSFADGLLTDVEFTAALENIDGENTLAEDNQVPVQTFSLIKLVTSIVKRVTAPLHKEIEDVRTANNALQEEINALKAEKAEAIEASGGALAPAATVETALAPYKEALLKLAPMEKSLQNQQRYLDQDDAKKRETNIIINGVTEATLEENELNDDDEQMLDPAITEESKDTGSVNEILQVIGCGDIVPLKVKRLGTRKDEEGCRPRPILVITDSADTRRKILKKKMNLKDNTDDRFKSVYIKADEPLAVQREWKRLRDALKKEKKAPTNQGATVKIDYKLRVLLRNDTVIDRFNSPFQKRGPSQ